MRQQARQPHERHAARGSDFRTGWLRSWVWRSSSSLGFFVGQIDVLVPGCCGIAPNPQARVVDSCSTSSRAAVMVARNRTQLAANQQSACRSDLPGQQCRMPVMTPEKLDMAHWLLAESNGQADISADKRPNKKGGRNRPEKYATRTMRSPQKTMRTRRDGSSHA